MNASDIPANREFWLARARDVSRRVNLAWWLETLATPLVVMTLLAAVVLLPVRREFPQLQAGQPALAIGLAVFLLAVACLALARRKFESPAASLVRIEAAMKLGNALSTAAAGVRSWPDPIRPVRAGLDWHWPRLLAPPLGALILLAAGLLIPVSREIHRLPPATQPQAWQELTTELEALSAEQAVSEKYLEETRKRLEELKNQPEDQWFSHSSLEATDSLKESHRAESRRMEREMDKTGNALETLEKNAANAGPAERERIARELDQALQGIENGAMKPNPQLLEQLRELNPNALENLSPEQTGQLRENLRKNAQALRQARGDGDGSDELAEAGGQEGESHGNGRGQGDGNQGDGEVMRGPGHDPDVLGQRHLDLDTGDPTGLKAQDLSHSAPGDLLELRNGEHDVDKVPSPFAPGGDIDATGKGGDRVWRDSLAPDEQRILKRFYE